MTNLAKEDFEKRENKIVEFLTRYHDTRKDTDPLLHLAYAIQELLQIVKWLRIEINQIQTTKVDPTTIHHFELICDCSHYQNIHTAGLGVCNSHDGNDFNCDCKFFTLLER